MFPYDGITQLCYDGDLEGIKAKVEQYPELDLNMRNEDNNSIILDLALHNPNLVIPFLNLQNDYPINIHDQRTDMVGWDEIETETVFSLLCRHSVNGFLQMLDYAIATNQDVNLNQRWVDGSKTLFDYIALKKSVLHIKSVLEKTIYFKFPVRTFDLICGIGNQEFPYYPFFSHRQREDEVQKNKPVGEDEEKKTIETDKFMIVAGFGKNMMTLRYEKYKDTSFSKNFKSVFSGQQKTISLRLMILRKFVYRTDGYRSRLRIPYAYKKNLLQWPDYDYEVEKYDNYVFYLKSCNSKRKRN